MSGLRNSSLIGTMALLLCGAAPSGLVAQSSAAAPASTHVSLPSEDVPAATLFMKVKISAPLKTGALRPGDAVEGSLLRPVYSGGREVFPAASRVRLTVDKLQRRRRTPNDHWPWVIKAFSPRHEKYPTFQSAVVSLPNGREIPTRVSLVSFGRELEVHALHKNPSPSVEVQESKRPPKPTAAPTPLTVTLQAMVRPAESEGLTEDSSAEVPATPLTLVAGTEAKVILLGDVSASRSHPGESFQARLVEPVRLGSTVVLPEGSLLQGQVVKSAKPRMLSRSGSLLLGFTGLTLPGGNDTPVAASVTGVAVDQRSHTKVDPEGMLHGDHPGKAWMLLNAGAAGGMAKAADDGTQLVVEAIVSTATDASTAGTARIAATCISGVFMLTRHGRDVVLPKFTEMNIMFNRPVSISPPAATTPETGN